MRYNPEDLIEIEFFLKDEQERADKCEDEFTKKLLLNRCIMWERLIAEIKGPLKEEPKDEGN